MPDVRCQRSEVRGQRSEVRKAPSLFLRLTSDICHLFSGPWRAVLVLCVTQILAWGAIYYPPVLTVPLIAADRGWSATLAMGGFSFGLLVAGVAAPRVGALIDRYGGHRVMPAGSLIGALGLVGLVHADHPVTYFAVWRARGLSRIA